MGYRYFICDVFTEARFGGNQLAVLPEAAGLSDRQMQQIAREFNFSESTFVLPPEAGQTRRVRIFTPTMEVPFAGHPNIGTAFVLATSGELGELGPSTTVTFEEKAGLVADRDSEDPGKPIWSELAAPQPLTLGKTVSAESLAAAVSLAPDDIVTRRTASGRFGWAPVPVAELKDRGALDERGRT